MARDRSADVQNQVNALIARDPQLRQLLTQAVSGNQGARKQFEQRLASLGFQMDKDYHIDWNDQDYQNDVRAGNARIDIDRDNWFKRNADWAIPVGVGAATLGAGLAGLGPAAGLAGGAPAATTATAASTGGATVGGLGGAAAASVPLRVLTNGGGIGGALGKIGLRDWLLIGGMGSSALSEWYRTRQMDKAAGREIDMSREALALEKEMFDAEMAERQADRTEEQRRYDQAYDDAAPYRSIGLGALDRLAFGVGIPGKPSEAVAASRNSRAPSPTQMQPWTDGPAPTFTGGGSLTSGSLATLGQPAAANVSKGAMVSIRSPQGRVVMVPFGQVEEALANGGQRV